MNTDSRTTLAAAWPTAAALALLMALTRVGHLGEFSRLPDASWAVFFLGGLLLRDARGFAAFFALAWGADLVAMALGTPADCFSLAYLTLVPSYAALWWGGRFAARGTAQPLPAVLRGGAALGVAVVGAFLLSNLGYFAFGPDTALSASEYAARVAGYLPAYLLVTATYTGVALLAGLLAVRAAQAARH